MSMKSTYRLTDTELPSKLNVTQHNSVHWEFETRQ
jgi:hypothetical protein